MYTAVCKVHSFWIKNVKCILFVLREQRGKLHKEKEKNCTVLQYKKTVFSEKIGVYGKAAEKAERDFIKIYGGKQK